MTSGYSPETNELDHIRHTQGTTSCKKMFINLATERRQEAINLINDEKLFFSSLFILKPEIEELNLGEELSIRNQIALSVCERIINGKNHSYHSENPVNIESEEIHQVLLWMFNSGVSDDGQTDCFDHILDTVASILVKTHHENTILPVMIDMIFKRNQKGLYIHDLVWSCLLTRDLTALRLIADHLRASNSKDVELACKILHLPHDLPMKTSFEKQKQYSAYLTWLKENDPYLYFTGESFNFTDNPNPCSVDLEAKYLCKENCLISQKRDPHLSDKEQCCLISFNNLSEKERALLAKQSQKLHGENPSYWNKWMQYTVDKQLSVAKRRRGDSYDCNC